MLEKPEQSPKALDPEKVAAYLREVINILYEGKEIIITKEKLQSVIDKAMEKLTSVLDLETEKLKKENFY